MLFKACESYTLGDAFMTLWLRIKLGECDNYDLTILFLLNCTSRSINVFVFSIESLSLTWLFVDTFNGTSLSLLDLPVSVEFKLVYSLPLFPILSL